MLLPHWRWCVSAIVTSLLVTVCEGAEEDASALAFSMQPEVSAYATSHDIPVEGIGNPRPGEGHPGDSVTALVALTDDTVVSQWLVQLTMAEATEKERSENPPAEMTVHGSAGREFHFSAGASVALDIRTAGPFASGKPEPSGVRKARTLMSPDFLAIGLDTSCRTMLKLSAEQAKRQATEGASAKPEQAGYAALQLSEADERAVMTLFPVLTSFVHNVQETPGLRDILSSVMKKPSLWSIVKNGGKVDLVLAFDAEAVAAVEQPPWAPADQPVYRMNFKLLLNGQPALLCSLFVVSPQPPLLTTAGIIGISARPPGSNPKQLYIRVISAHRADAH